MRRRNAIKRSALVGATVFGLSGCVTGDTGSEGEEFPTSTIQSIIPYEPGGGVDVLGRKVNEYYADELGVTIEAENIPGAASLNGLGQLATSDSDGYKFGYSNIPGPALAFKVEDPPFDITDVEGLAGYSGTSVVIVTNPEDDVEGYSDLVDRYKTGEFSTIGGADLDVTHLIPLFMRDAHGLDFEQFVGYDGGAPAVQAVASGEIDAALTSEPGAAASVEEGLVDPVAHTYSEGGTLLTEVPTVTQEGYENIDNVGRVVGVALLPSGVPEERISILENAMENAIDDDELIDWMDNAGGWIEFLSGDEVTDMWMDIHESVNEIVDVDDLK
jgi:tripartite-type tricarboxylate transporter receptor subunit TctC